MTAASQLLAELNQLGVAVWAVGDHLRFKPRSAVDPGLLARLRIVKPEILVLLDEEATEVPLVQARVVARSAAGVEVVEVQPINPPGPIRWERRVSFGGVCSLVGDATENEAAAAGWIDVLRGLPGTVFNP